MDRWVASEPARTVRRMVLLAIGVSVTIVAVLIGHTYLFEAQIAAGAARAQRATALNGEILLLDERLTMSANMAAATGEARWIARYDEDIDLMDRAIRAAKNLAAPAVAERFDRETRAANDGLIAMERRAFELRRQGRGAEARAILDGPAYALLKRVLAQGSARFRASLLAAAENGLAQVAMRARWTFGGLLAFAAIGFWLLWRNLDRSLDSSAQAYLRAQELATHDSLTGLPNRRLFDEELERFLARSRNGQGKVAVIMVDLDCFKSVNDRSGHAVGDWVLAGVGKFLSGSLRQGEICARLGGDEFAAALSFGGDNMEPYLAALRIVESVSAPIEIDGSTYVLGATAGIAVCPDDGWGAGELIRKADVALYRAKSKRRGGVCFFNEAIDSEVRIRATASARERTARRPPKPLESG